MYAPHVLPAARDYDALYRSFRWQVPARYNIGVDVCDRWAAARAGPHRDPQRARRRRHRRDQLRRAAGDLEPARQCARGARHRARRPRRDPAAAGAGGRRRAISRSTSSAPSRCRSRCCSASRRSAYRLADSGARALITNAQGLAKLAGIRDALPDLELVLSIDGAATARWTFDATLARASRRFHAGATTRGRSGADDLHLRHDRPAEGRAARPSRPARASARHRVAA